MARARLNLGEDHARVAVVAVVDRVHVVAELDRPGVRGREVIGLVEGVHRGLPVALDLDRAVESELPALEVVGVEVLGDHAEILAQRCGVRVEADEHEAGPGFAMHGTKAQPIGGHALREALGVERAQQLAVEVVLPAVEQAAELAGVTTARLAEPIAPVHTDVVTRGERAIALAHHQHRLGADLIREVVAGLGCVRGTAREQPHLGPHALPLELRELAAGVALLRNRDMVECGLGSLRHGCRAHGIVSAVGGRISRIDRTINY